LVHNELFEWIQLAPISTFLLPHLQDIMTLYMDTPNRKEEQALRWRTTYLASCVGSV